MPYRPITPHEIPIVADIQSRAFRFPAERYLEAYNGSGRVDHRALRLLENDAGQPAAAPRWRPARPIRRCAVRWMYGASFTPAR